MTPSSCFLHQENLVEFRRGKKSELEKADFVDDQTRGHLRTFPTT